MRTETVDAARATLPVGVRSREPRWARPLLRAGAVLLAALHTVAAVKRQSMNEDGINYLDVGSAVAGGDWHAAVNAIWSPLYALLIGTIVNVVQPSPWWEFPVVQMANLGIFVITMFCFEFFWRELTSVYHAGPEPLERIPPVVWLTLGYSLWIWSSLALIRIWAVTPDMLVSACVYVAAGLLLRLGGQAPSRRLLAGLGAVLGVGYLAKAAMFPLALVCLTLAAGVLYWRGHRPARVGFAVLGFAVVAGPFVLALSLEAGHPTFGEVGGFTYMKHVNRLRYPHPEETLAHVNGTRAHPPRLLREDPPVYEFADPVAGTYPLAFDPGYWTRGLAPRIDATQQLTAITSNGILYFELFLRRQGVFVAVVLLLLVLAARPLVRDGAAQAALVLWASSAFALYSLVYVSPRYIAPFIVLFWAGLLASARWPALPSHRRLATAGSWILVASVWMNIGSANLEDVGKFLRFTPGPPSDPGPAVAIQEPSGGPSDPHPAIAEGLRQVGLRPGDPVGFIGYSFSAFWARLARVRIVAEMEPHHAPPFWSSGEEGQADVLAAFAAAGVVAVISEPTDVASIPAGWSRVPGTEHLVYLLR